MTEQYYTLKEVASMLKVRYLTIYRWIQAGKLEVSRVGKQYRISQAVLDRLLVKYEVKV